MFTKHTTWLQKHLKIPFQTQTSVQFCNNSCFNLDFLCTKEDNEPLCLQGDMQPNHPGQILLPPLHIKISLSALWSDKANPASLLSISTCCTTSPCPEKKSPSLLFHKFGVFIVLLPSPSLPCSPLLMLHSAVTIRSLYHPHPVCRSPHTSLLPSVLSYHPSSSAELLWAILLWPQPINLLQLDNDL